MKKILSILLLTIILSASCCCGEPEQVSASKGALLKSEELILPGPVKDENEDPYTNGMRLVLSHFTLDGHEYIAFQYVYDMNIGYSTEGGVVHDPECQKCKSANKSPLSSAGTGLSYESIFDW